MNFFRRQFPLWRSSFNIRIHFICYSLLGIYPNIIKMTSKIFSAIKSNMNDKSCLYVQIGILSTVSIHFDVVAAAAL